MAACYPQGIVNLITGTQDWNVTTDWKAQLTLSTYTYADTHQFQDDVSASQVSGTTDQVLTEVAPTDDTANNRVKMDASNDPVWTSVASGTCDSVIIYYDTGTPATSPLISYNDFSGGDIVADGGDITVQFAATGVWAVAYA